jgi:hypothetical protein
MLRVGIVLSPGFQMMCFAAISAFELASFAAGEPRYGIAILSERGGPAPEAPRLQPPQWRTGRSCAAPSVPSADPRLSGGLATSSRSFR